MPYPFQKICPVCGEIFEGDDKRELDEEFEYHMDKKHTKD